MAEEVVACCDVCWCKHAMPFYWRDIELNFLLEFWVCLLRDISYLVLFYRPCAHDSGAYDYTEVNSIFEYCFWVKNNYHIWDMRFLNVAFCEKTYSHERNIVANKIYDVFPLGGKIHYTTRKKFQVLGSRYRSTIRRISSATVIPRRLDFCSRYFNWGWVKATDLRRVLMDAHIAPLCGAVNVS